MILNDFLLTFLRRINVKFSGFVVYRCHDDIDFPK